jgi:hypothetical protein
MKVDPERVMNRRHRNGRGRSPLELTEVNNIHKRSFVTKFAIKP